jgi:hypothetical protein
MYVTIHYNDDTVMEESDDRLQKIRPLLNVLKHTLGSYINCGKNLCLDETTDANRSIYGMEHIFYSHVKNTGKLHLKYYLLCECYWCLCTIIVMHTRTSRDLADPVFDKMCPDINDPVIDDLPEFMGVQCNPDDEEYLPNEEIDLEEEGAGIAHTCDGVTEETVDKSLNKKTLTQELKKVKRAKEMHTSNNLILEIRKP